MSVFDGRYVFVAGLHRTGTSLVSRILASHSKVATIENSPAPENEGCYLQGVIPHTAQHGIPGEYAVDPSQRHTEDSPYNSLETRNRLTSDWDRWFEVEGQWRVEKSPVNLTRMRLYQQLFPMAQFVIVLRHPEAMSAALAKWTTRPADGLIDYALTAYDIAIEDMEYLHCAYIIRYEDFVAQPEREISKLFKFLSLEPETLQVDLRDGNADYANARRLTREQAATAEKWGYGPEMRVSTMPAIIKHPLRSVRELIAA